MSSEFSHLLMQASKLFSLVKNRICLYGKRKIFHFCSFSALHLGTASAFLTLPETLLLPVQWYQCQALWMP